MSYRKSEIVVYRGIKFRRYPDAKQWSDRNYYTPGIAARKAGVGYLHREIYKDRFGEIPAGYDVHHKDNNPLNNDPDNLECIEHGEHLRLHAATLSQERRAAMRENLLKRAVPKAREWHGSGEGREWHRQHAKRFEFGKFEPVERTCDQCGQVFEAQIGHSRFCSNKCKSAFRRASGADNEIRQCEQCGCEFSVNHYSKTTCCSRACAGRMRWSRKRASLQSDG